MGGGGLAGGGGRCRLGAGSSRAVERDLVEKRTESLAISPR